MQLTFVGSGDAFGSGGRFNTCFHVTSAAGEFLIDCGATSLVALNRCSFDIGGIRTIFISHLHGDHFAGLPFFLLDAQFIHRRDRPLTIAGPVGLTDRLKNAQELLFPGSSGIEWNFELETVELRTRVSREVNSVDVTPYEMDHPSGAPSFALRLECDDGTLTYSGDTQWTDELLPAADGADLFICECYALRDKAPYHLDLGTLVEKRPLFNVGRMIVTHMGPAMLAHDGEIPFERAHDGLVVDV